jgi:hypothetical protein
MQSHDRGTLKMRLFFSESLLLSRLIQLDDVHEIQPVQRGARPPNWRTAS